MPAPVAPTDPALVIVGRIGRAHGLHGEVTVEVRTDDPADRFADGAVLLTVPVARGPLTVSGARANSGRLLLTFVGVEDRTAAEVLRDTLLQVRVDLDERPDDPEEFFDHQLVGLRVEDPAGTALGLIAEVLHLPGQDVLAVRTETGREVLIPFVAQMVPVVDLDGARLVVDLPAGLLDLPG